MSVRQGGQWATIGAALALGAWAPSAIAAVDFAPRNTVKVGKTAAAVVSGDFSGDGVADLVAADLDAVAVFTGRGDGGFTPGARAPAARPTALAAADLNGDGKLDVAVANGSAGTVGILLGDGAGGLSSAGAIRVGVTPVAIAAGDVNGDGRTDLVASNLDSNNATLLLGNGDGTFTSTFIGVGPVVFDAVLGDVTGEGQADLVVAGDTVRVFPGPFAGPPPPSLTPPTTTLGTDLAVADLNGDGHRDIATANGFSYDVSVILGGGGGAFRRMPVLPASNGPSAIAAGDVNADGRPDLVVANADSNDVTVLEGLGTGRFRAGRQFRAGLFPTGVEIVDVNRDGRGDVVVSNGGGSVSVLRSRAAASGSTGTAKVRVTCPTPRRAVHAVSIGCVATLMSRAQVVELLGRPRAVRRDRASGDYAYVYPRLVVGFGGDSNAVNQVSSERPGAGFPNGPRVGAPAVLVAKRFPGATCRSRRGVRFCTAVRARVGYTGFVIKGGTVTEIDVGLS